MKRRFALVLAIVLLTPQIAKADPPEPATRTWYGYQTLLTDGAAVAMFAGGAATDHAALGAGSGALTYFLAAPLVHLAHDNRSGAGKSLALRLLAPVGGALVGGTFGYAIEGKGDYALLAPLLFGIGGAMVGAGVASLVDAFAFARTKPDASSITAIPSIALTPKGASIGLGGRF